MPSLRDPIPDGTEPPVATVPPVIDPATFERFEGLRETTLAFFTVPEDNAALRQVGQLLYSMALETNRFWPPEPEGLSSSKAAPWSPICATCKAPSLRWTRSARLPL